MTTANRVKKLERFRILHFVLTTVNLMLLVFFCSWTVKNATWLSRLFRGQLAFEAINVKQLIIRNDASSEIIRMSADDVGGGLVKICDESGEIMLMLSTEKDGGQLMINNRQASPGVMLFAKQAGGALVACNKEGKISGVMGADDAGHGYVTVKDTAGQSLAVMNRNQAGLGQVATFLKGGKSVPLAPTTTLRTDGD